MRAFATLWRRLTSPSAELADPESQRRARLLLSLIVPLLPVVFATALIAPMLSHGPLNPLTFQPSQVGLATGVVLLSVYLVGRTRRHELASMALVGLSTVSAFVNFLASRGEVNDGFVLAFLSCALLLSGLLLSVRVTIALATSHVLGLLALMALLPDIDAAYVVIPIVFVVMSAFLVVVSSAVRSFEAVQRKTAEDAMRASESRYRVLVERSPDAILVHSGGKVLFANAAAQQLFAAPEPQALVGADVLDLTDPTFRDVVKEISAKPVEIRVRRLDGRPVDVEAMGAFADHDGKRADQTILRDVTARKEAEAAGRLARERLDEIARLQDINLLKTQLLNMASHELNTPIAALRLQLHMLKMSQDKMDPRSQKALTLLDRNVDRLALLVKDVLDVARLQSGQLAVRKAHVDLASVARDVSDFYAEAYRVGGVNLSVEAESAPADADAQRITQVLNNLLSNALKFTPPGGDVHLRVARQGEEVLVSLSDTGPGLSVQQIGRLFQPFSQVHDTTKGTHGGTGLGLHICKGIVEQHGGRIWAESAGPGQGSKFSFAIPLAAPVVVAR